MRKQITLSLTLLTLTSCGADFKAAQAKYVQLKPYRDACIHQVGDQPNDALVIFGVAGALIGQAITQNDRNQWVEQMHNCMVKSGAPL